MAPKMPTQKNFRPRDYVTGRVKLPPDVAALASQWFCYTASIGETNGVQLADGASTTIPVQIDDSAYFLVEGIHAISSLQDINQDKIMIQVTDTTTSRPWSDLPVPLRDFAGKGDSPKYLSDPQIVRPTGTLSVQITNNTGSAIDLYVAFIGRKIYGVTEEMANLLMRRSYFQYVANFAGLAASATGLEPGSNAKVKVINDSDFLVKRLLSQQLINATIGLAVGALSSEVMMMLRDSNGDRNYMDNPVPARLLLGSNAGETSTLANQWGNGSPMSLVKPILIRRNSILQIKLSNKSVGAIASEFNITLEGVKVYDMM
jgi:hypothetical protein